MTTLTNTLKAWLAAGDTASVREAIKTMDPADVANEIGGLRADQAARILTALPPDRQGTVFGYFDAAFQIAMARALPRAELADILLHAEPEGHTDGSAAHAAPLRPEI
jgi:Mg/Co/Ni transporter MgtE